jgi:hypothetical protein
MLWEKISKNPAFLVGLVAVGLTIVGLFFSMIGGPEPREDEKRL